MGMATSGAAFQRLMDQVMGELQPQCVAVYLDDLTVFLPDFYQHLYNLEEVLSWLAKAGLKINLDKCKFAKPKVKVLGHIVSQEGSQPDPAKTEAMLGMSRPSDKMGV